jgi:hypothetical protein
VQQQLFGLNGWLLRNFNRRPANLDSGIGSSWRMRAQAGNNSPDRAIQNPAPPAIRAEPDVK